MNDDDFDRALMQRVIADDNDATAAAEEAADLAALGEALVHYRERSLDWAERRSASMPSPLRPSPRAGRLRVSQWALSTAALVACVAGGTAYMHRQGVLADTVTNGATAAPTQQALAADNELLSSVDDALNGSAAPTEEELGLKGTLLGVSGQKLPDAERRSN